MQPRRITVLGVGLLGGSIGLALKSIKSNDQIIGYGHRRETLDRALKMGAIDVAAENPGEAVKDADLVILCTPVGLFPQLLRQIAPDLKPGAIVTDVGSTKRSIVREAAALPPGIHFVGSHPMAGSEKRGVEFAKADLFQGAVCILTPTSQTNLDAVTKVEAFWQLLGMKTCRMTPEEHDRRTADISHLPHALAAALISMQSDDALPLAGNGFLDSTRIASGDGALWRDILIDNQDNLRNAIARLKSQLDGLVSLLDTNQSEQLRLWLDEAANRRDSLVRLKTPGESRRKI